METVKWKGHQVRLYTTLKMPVDNFLAFNKAVLIDAGIGSDLNSIDQHLANLVRLAKDGKTSEHRQEVLNMRQNLAFVMNKMSPRMQAFAALVHSIDGTICDDLTDEGLQDVLARLGRKKMPFSLLYEWLEKVKKKLSMS